MQKTQGLTIKQPARLGWLALLLLLLSASQVALAQAGSWQWRNLTPATGDKPSARRNGAAIFDPVGKRLILFGGNSDEGLQNDTWAYVVATRTWTKLTTTGTPPPPRLGFDAVYDSVGHQLVVYSGQGSSSFLNDTWTLDLNTLAWRDVSPVSESARPRRRYGSASVFDPVSRSLVQFAGFTSEAGRFQDTQAFGLANQAWADWTPSGEKPVVRCLLTAAFDRTNRRMIVYAGQRSGPLDDIWAFNLATRTWANLTPTSRPAGRYFANSFVDQTGQFFIFGGQGNSGVTNEVWSFNLAQRQWTKQDIANPPSARSSAQGAYDESGDRFYLFGGGGNSGNLSDLWEMSRMSAPSALTTVSAASFASGAQGLAPDSIVTAFGANLAAATVAATSTPLPETLAGVSVRVTDSANVERAAALYFVSTGQLNFLLPAATANGNATVRVMREGVEVANGMVQVSSVAPGLFTANANGQGWPAGVLLRVNADGSQVYESMVEWNAAQNRFDARAIDLGGATERVFLVLFGTGWRKRTDLNAVSVRLGGLDAPVFFAGDQMAFTGVDQVNAEIPRALSGRGEAELTMTVNGRSANSVRVLVK